MLGIAVDESGLIKGEHRVGSSLNLVLVRELVNNPKTDDEAILQRGGKYTLFHTQDPHAKRLKVPHEVLSWRDPKLPERSRLEYRADLRNFQAALGAKAPMPDELFRMCINCLKRIKWSYVAILQIFCVRFTVSPAGEGVGKI